MWSSNWRHNIKNACFWQSNLVLISCESNLWILIPEGEYIQLPDNVLERDGNGTHSSCDGTTYEGTWSKDKMHGHGKIQFPSGAFYEGNFQENKFHGAGTYCWPNGSFFRGTFIDNKFVLASILQKCSNSYVIKVINQN